MRSDSRRLFAMLAVSVLLFAACGGDDEDSGGNGTSDGGGGEPASSELAVEAVDFNFDPGELSVEAGADVTLQFSNGGEAPHTFTADDVGVDVRLDPGGSEAISFTAPDEDTTVEWMCTIHPQMTGSLVVGEGGAATSKSDKGSKDADGLDY